MNFLIGLEITLTALVFGYAFACTAIVHPALLETRQDQAVGFFKPFFNKSAKVQMASSLAAMACGLVVLILGGGWAYLAIGVFLQISAPYTIKFLMPINNRIMDENADPNSQQMKEDLVAWGKMHFPRTVIAGVSFVALLIVAL